MSLAKKDDNRPEGSHIPHNESPGRCPLLSIGALTLLDMRISARNQLSGTITSMEHGSVMSTVVMRLEGGQEVVAAITKDSAEHLELKEGDAVTAVIKSTEVMVAKD